MTTPDPLAQQADALKLALQWKIRHGTAKAIGDYSYLDDEAGGIILAALQRVQAETREEAIEAASKAWRLGASSLPKLIAGMRARWLRKDRP